MGQVCFKRKAMDVAPTYGPRVICDIFAGTVNTREQPLDMSTVATPGHVRLLDCQAMKEQGFIRIVEFPEFPTVSYAALSYPWYGVSATSASSPSPSPAQHTFAVHGATNADPIGLETLRHACAAALHQSCPYLWIDRLCIVRTDAADTNWHLRHMHHLYASCRVCVVLPGGLLRLARIDEETPWIHRSWTLLEAVAPPHVVILLAWSLGAGTATVAGFCGAKTRPIHEVIAGESAIAPLSLVLDACIAGSLSFTPTPAPTPPPPTPSPSPPGPQKPLLIDACTFTITIPSSLPPSPITSGPSRPGPPTPLRRPSRPKRHTAPALALTLALDDVLSTDPDARAHALWQSAALRTASRPVDAVLALAPLLGVSLDPAQFPAHARRAALRALAHAVLASGASASWLGVGVASGAGAGRDPRDSSFPAFPAPCGCGRGRGELPDPVYPVGAALVPLPRGTMDARGYVSLAARALRVCPVQGHAGAGAGARRTLRALDGTEWEVHDDASPHAARPAPFETGARLAYAALLGWYSRCFSAPGVGVAAATAVGVGQERDSVRVLLLEEHGAGLFHVRSFFVLSPSEKAYVLMWPERAFCVGGPDALDADGEEDEEESGSEKALGERRGWGWTARPNAAAAAASATTTSLS